MGLTAFTLPEHALAQISVSITLAPPALPAYEQPVLVEQGGIWAPGYWAYNQDGYFWVPGTWVQPPEFGLLWTPGYWGWGNGGYAWNEGYWGTTVGFYGGINYGFGYSGHGYTGGHWQGQQFYYNRTVSHVNVTNIHNVYNETIVNNTTVNRTSFNGGSGGITSRPTALEQSAARAPHQPATPVQHRQGAMSIRALSTLVNHGNPEIAATSKPAEFNGSSAVKLKSTGSLPVHAAELSAIVHQATPTTGNVARDKANQQQQNELRAGQETQRQELQQRQTADHAQAAKQPASPSSVQALEAQHQAQTQALAQRHATEQNALHETQVKTPEAKHESPHT
jgi:hypothetical protein